MGLRQYARSIVAKAVGTLTTVSSSRGWLGIIRESFTGAWQRNITIDVDCAVSQHAFYACVTLIAADIGKLRPKLMLQDPKSSLWSETTAAAFSPVLRKPNRFQTHIQFKEYWITSKLIRGNAYVLLQRNASSVVEAMYLLDPTRVQVLVAPDGSVFYDLGQDLLSGVMGTSVRVPASEIIHDRMNCLFHPLVGTSPIIANGMAIETALRIQRDSAAFFGNASAPGGVLLAPKAITDSNAREIKEYWDANFSGNKQGKIAVLGDGMTFQPMRMSAVDSQLLQQLEWSDKVVCSTMHVPPFMIGVGPEPAYANGETRTGHYYSQCLQSHIESMEELLDYGLGLEDRKDSGAQYGVELDLDGLIRMDGAALMTTLTTGVKGGVLAPNEARRKLNEKPLPGGDAIYLQVQNYSLQALAARDAAGPAPGGTPPPAAPAPPPDDGPPDDTPPSDDPAAAAAKAEEAAAETLMTELLTRLKELRVTA